MNYMIICYIMMKQTFNSIVCFALTSACMCLCTYVSTSSTTHFSGASKVQRVSSYRSVEEGGPGSDDRCNACNGRAGALYSSSVYL